MIRRFFLTHKLSLEIVARNSSITAKDAVIGVFSSISSIKNKYENNINKIFFNLFNIIKADERICLRFKSGKIDKRSDFIYLASNSPFLKQQLVKYHQFIMLGKLRQRPINQQQRYYVTSLSNLFGITDEFAKENSSNNIKVNKSNVNNNFHSVTLPLSMQKRFVKTYVNNFNKRSASVGSSSSGFVDAKNNADFDNTSFRNNSSTSSSSSSSTKENGGNSENLDGKSKEREKTEKGKESENEAGDEKGEAGDEKKKRAGSFSSRESSYSFLNSSFITSLRNDVKEFPDIYNVVNFFHFLIFSIFCLSSTGSNVETEWWMNNWGVDDSFRPWSWPLHSLLTNNFLSMTLAMLLLHSMCHSVLPFIGPKLLMQYCATVAICSGAMIWAGNYAYVNKTSGLEAKGGKKASKKEELPGSGRKGKDGDVLLGSNKEKPKQELLIVSNTANANGGAGGSSIVLEKQYGPWDVVAALFVMQALHQKFMPWQILNAFSSWVKYACWVGTFCVCYYDWQPTLTGTVLGYILCKTHPKLRAVKAL